ncbi:hypothetical protein AWJ20_3348 [Sugiyamaella lignohabitans]|uniref:Uncharacterized protein n=1 Tax=Sugiyamaella lignohabitans TaxID=796027 RepID=A0A167FU86_9ASCO|nr:uncharacterized protein AWJ20_3348 [Sugiyamaella lignohabitans]ANB15709.1 hypothetical protein AWJ20_3348 [Sugiyamaella lignohabitans]
MKRFQEAMKDLNGEVSDDGDDEWTDIKKTKEVKSTKVSEEVSSEKDSDDEPEGESWAGFDSESRPNGILKKKQTFDDDDDGTVVVTIEDLSEPLHIDKYVDVDKSESVLEGSINRAQEYAKFVLKDEKKKPQQSKPKKKFRYLTKVERKAHVSKERSRNRQKRDKFKK